LSLLVAWIVYPLVLLALCLGLGLLVDVLGGRRLPGALLAPVGLAAIVVVGQFTTLFDATAELTVPLLVLLAVLGAGLALPWRFGRPDPWAAGAALAVFAVFAAPVVLSGAATFAGYIKLDDTATWFALTDRVMEHGRSLAGLEPSTYRATLDFNLAAGYPIGVFLPFGAAQKLTGGDLAWVFQPYVSFLAAMLALGLWQIGGGFRRLLERPALRALAVFVAAQPALLFGYAMWGGVKEVAAAAFIVLAAALAPAAVRVADIDHPPVGSKSDAPDDARRIDAVLLALPAAALVGVLSLGGLVWLGPMLLAVAVLAWRAFGPRDALLQALAFVVPLAVLVVPVVSSGLVPPTSSPLTDASAEGNLRGPLNALQVLGIWPSGDFRFDPDGAVVTAVLVALGIGAAAVGLWLAWARRQMSLLLYAASLLACAAIVLIGSPWAGAKALATASPVALSLAVAGAVAALRADRVVGAILVAAVAGGVLWSNVLAYGGASLAPYDQLVELEQIGEEFAGQGPALMTEYNPYGARHFLRELDAEGASELRVRPVTLRDGGTAEKGIAVDVDEVDLDALFVYRTLVLRRSPVSSRPPLPYRLAWAGEHYEVWQRPEVPGDPVLSHQPLGGELDAGGVPNCSEVTGLGLLALSNQLGQPPGSIRLVAAPRAPVYDATDGRFAVPRAGRYDAWLKGSVRGSVELLVDGSEVGAARHELNNDGGYIYMGETTLGRDAHRAELRFGGADLRPGSGGFPRPETGPLLFAPAATEAASPLATVPVDEADRLCGRRWDWIEAVGTG
jgi:hypothetical protein